ncbi:MAG: hypothetical protein ACFE9S_17455 [Candidatus Hermodarchaeota archaeon]
MDCYDEILEISQENDQLNMYIIYLAELINKKANSLTSLQFKNCVILTLAIWNPKFIDSYFSEGEKANQLEENRKALLINLLKSELSDFDY